MSILQIFQKLGEKIKKKTLRNPQRYKKTKET